MNSFCGILVSMNVSRYVENVELKFRVQFVTPCFLGGADGNAEIRTAPFKNAIRYWWRVLYGAKYLDNLLEAESSIFGIANKLNTIKSNITIEISSPNYRTGTNGFPKGEKIEVTHDGKPFNINILDYLAYGKYAYEKGFGNVYSTTHIEPDSQIDLIITLDKKNLGPHFSEVKDAIKFFFRYGGIGSRSRNGFGSLKTTTDYEWSKNITCGSLLDFPVLSEKSHLFVSRNVHPTWESALSELGVVYKAARGTLEARHSYVKRGYVARPIEVKHEKIPDNIRSGRIPKPFYLHILKTEEGFRGQVLCLPVLFYEKNKQSEYMKVYDDMISTFMKSKSIIFEDETALLNATNILQKISGGTK